MSEEKDIFNELVRERLNNLEVPYNEAHWEEMSQKLDQMGPLPKSGRPWYVKGLFIAGAGALVAVATWMAWPETETAVSETAVKENPTSPAMNQVQPETQVNSVKSTSPESTLPATVTNSPVEKTSNPVQKTEKPNSVETEVDKWADRTEDKIKANAEIEIETALKDQKEQMGAEPKINNPNLRTSIVVLSKTLCVGEPIAFDVDKKHDNVSYSWDFGDKALTSRQMSPEHTFNRPGTFRVLVMVSRNGEEKNNYQAEYTVTIGPKPEVQISVEQKDLTMFDAYSNVVAQSNVPCNFTWTFNEKEQATGSKASFFVQDKGNYPVSVVAESKNGCTNTASEYIYAQRGFHTPVENTFTPDGNAYNQTFLPIELRESNHQFDFIVKDQRTGQVVFESHDGERAWDGTLNNNGSPLPEGNYLWQIVVKDIRGIERTQQGKILLMRR